MADRTMPKADEIEKGKVMAILAFIPCFLIPLLAARDNRYAMYHTEQSIILLIVAIILYVAVSVAVSVLIIVLGSTIGVAGPPPLIVKLIVNLVVLALLALWVLGLINAATGKCKPLPIIGQFGEKLNLMK